MAAPEHSPLVIRHGDLVIDLVHYRVLRGEIPIILSYREYALLVYLAMRAGRLVSRRQLLEEGLGRHDAGGMRTVDEHMRHLRSKLERHGVPVVEMVDGVGYRFLVQERDGPPGGPAASVL